MLEITVTHNTHGEPQDCSCLLLTSIVHVKTLHRILNTNTNSNYPKRK